MRKIHRTQSRLDRSAVQACIVIAGAAVSGTAEAQFVPGHNSHYSNQTYTYGLNLPQAPIPNGQDEVRAADGTSCRSSMASNSAYLDVGAVGNDGSGSFNEPSGTFYGRIIMPLGETPRRVDCTRLFELEILRLRHELELVRSGAGYLGETAATDMKAGAPAANLTIKGPPAAAKKGAWAESGWSNSGWKSQQKVGLADVAVPENSPASAPPVTPDLSSQAIDQAESGWSTRISRPVEPHVPSDQRRTVQARHDDFQPFKFMGGGF